MKLDDLITRARARVEKIIGGMISDRSDQGFKIKAAKLYLRFSSAERYRFYRTYGRLLDADVASRDALEFIYIIVSQDGEKPSNMMAIAVAQWLRGLREHGRLSLAVTGWVPRQEVLLIEAGEKSGKFGKAMGIMLELNEKMGEVRGKLASKLPYPIFSALVLAGIIYFMSTEFLPMILTSKPADQWTGSAGSTVHFLQWAQSGLGPSLFAIVAALIGIIATLPYFTGSVRTWCDRLPPWSIHRFLTGTAFMTAVLVYMESGRNLREALELSRENTSPYLVGKINRSLRLVREGIGFGKALQASGENFPERELIQEIQLFEKLGRLDEGLGLIVTSWITDATERMQTQVGILSQAIMMVNFTVLGFVFNGYYDIMNQLSQGH